jgi:hypothetical protein
MKKQKINIQTAALLTAVLLGVVSITTAQNLGISATGSPPDNSALLDVDATGMNPKKGVLIPRMTTAERNAIPIPAPSLLIFNTTTQCFEAYSGSNWVALAPCLNGCNPLISSPIPGSHSSTSNSITWNWNAVSTATAYYVNTTNNFATATNVGNTTSYNQTGLSCGQNYTLYVWAQNACGTSAPTMLTYSTTNCCPTSYVVTSIPYAPLSPPGATNPGPSGDDVEGGPYPIGFSFCFYGTTYTQFYISTNGFIDFPGGQGSGCCNGVAIPNTNTPNGLVAACWTDLNTNSGGNIDYFVTGVAPNRRLVVRWNNVAEYSSGGVYNGQIILYEGTNVIEIHSGTYIINGHTVAVGVENQGGTLGTGAPGYNTITNPNSSNQAWRFQ